MACSGCFDSRLSWVPADSGAVFPAAEEAGWYLDGSGYEADSIEVDYCPFCGVRLDAEAPENGAIWGVQKFGEWCYLELKLAEERARVRRFKMVPVEEWERIWAHWTRSQP